jgi:2-keto-4-pentenoate hydratase
MKAFSAEAAAAFLMEHFHDRTKAAPLLTGPATRADSYRVQDLLMGTLGHACGWKVGLAKPDAEPYCAPLPASRRLENGEVYKRYEGVARLEAELGLRLGRDVPSGAADLDRAECAELIDAVVPAIEILEPRLVEPQAGDALWKLADLQANGGVILGEPAPWRKQDLGRVSLAINADGSQPPTDAAHPFGDPLDLFCWVVRHVSRHRGGLRRGDVVITGSYCGIINLGSPQHFTATFPEYGAVSVNVI